MMRLFPAARAAVLLVAAAFLAGCSSQAVICDVCHRDECAAMTFRVEFADGGVQKTCCPRCASHAVAEAGDRDVSRLFARDFATGREIDARAAVFVDGSDFEHCSVPKEDRSAPGCCRVLAYDRCLPSLIAFASPDDADRFMHEHGGTLRSFDDLSFGRK